MECVWLAKMSTSTASSVIGLGVPQAFGRHVAHRATATRSPSVRWLHRRLDGRKDSLGWCAQDAELTSRNAEAWRKSPILVTLVEEGLAAGGQSYTADTAVNGPLCRRIFVSIRKLDVVRCRSAKKKSSEYD